MKKIIISVGLFLGALILIACGASPNDTDTPPAVYDNETSTSQTTTPAKPKGPVTVFGDGGYQVGTQVAAGKYRPTENLQDIDMTFICSWSIYRDDTQEDLVDIQIKDTGRPTLTVKKGQYLEVDDCGTFTKVN